MPHLLAFICRCIGERWDVFTQLRCLKPVFLELNPFTFGFITSKLVDFVNQSLVKQCCSPPGNLSPTRSIPQLGDKWVIKQINRKAHLTEPSKKAHHIRWAFLLIFDSFDLLLLRRGISRDTEDLSRLRINGDSDTFHFPVILAISRSSNNVAHLRKDLSLFLTVWIDPQLISLKVSIRMYAKAEDTPIHNFLKV